MKKFLALILAAILLAGCVSAFAEALPYFEQIPQNSFYCETYMTDASYPYILICPYYAGSVLSHDAYHDKVFTAIEKPAGTYGIDFDTNECSFSDETNGIVYYYSLTESAAYETFIAKADDDSYILHDGSEGYAVYIDPDDYTSYANALIAMPDYGKTAKLQVRMQFGNLRKASLESRIETISAAIEAEVARVKGSMVTGPIDEFFTKDAFCGFKLVSYDYNLSLTDNFSDITVAGETAREYVIESDGSRITTMMNFADFSVSVEYELGTYSYVEYQMEEAPDEVKEYTLSDGNSYMIYATGIDTDRYYGAYIHRAIYDKAGYDESSNYYLTIHLDADDCYFSSFDDIAGLLDSLVSGFGWETDLALLGNNPAPKAPEDAPAGAGKTATDLIGSLLNEKKDESTEPAPAAESDSSWVCPECGTENAGNFCGNCGTKKPEDPTWTCPDCGTVNETNFCGNCGAKRP